MNLVDLKVWSDLSISNDFRIAPDVASWFDSKQLHVQPAALPTCWWCWFCLEVNSWSLPPRCWILWSVFHDRLVLKQPMSVDCTRSILETRRSRGPKDVLSRGLERGSRWHRCGDAFRWNRQRQIPGASSCHHASHLPSGRKDSGLQGQVLSCAGRFLFLPQSNQEHFSLTQWRSVYILTSQALYLKIRVATLEANFMSPVFLSVISAWTMTQHDVFNRFHIFSPIFNSLRSSLFVPLQWRQSLMRIAPLLHYSCRAAFRGMALSINNSSIEKIRNV